MSYLVTMCFNVTILRLHLQDKRVRFVNKEDNGDKASRRGGKGKEVMQSERRPVDLAIQSEVPVPRRPAREPIPMPRLTAVHLDLGQYRTQSSARFHEAFAAAQRMYRSQHYNEQDAPDVSRASHVYAM